jgi:hypothetical protein
MLRAAMPANIYNLLRNLIFSHTHLSLPLQRPRGGRSLRPTPASHGGSRCCGRRSRPGMPPRPGKRGDAEAVLLEAPACAAAAELVTLTRAAAGSSAAPPARRRSLRLTPAHGGGACDLCPRCGGACGPCPRCGGAHGLRTRCGGVARGCRWDKTEPRWHSHSRRRADSQPRPDWRHAGRGGSRIRASAGASRWRTTAPWRHGLRVPAVQGISYAKLANLPPIIGHHP